MARKLPQPIVKEDFDKLIEYAKNQREKYRLKRSGKLKERGERVQEYMIAMCLGFGAGMRISEIFGLEKTQTYTTKKNGVEITKTIISSIPRLTKEGIENNYIRVISGKGRKDRIVPLPVKVLRSAGITRRILESTLPLKVSSRTIQAYITRLAKKVLKKHITFHTLRHGFVTHALESGIDIHQVQAFAGHSRLDTTGLYLHANPKKALDKYEEVF